MSAEESNAADQARRYRNRADEGSAECGAQGVVVRRLRPTDRDLPEIVDQINGASMEIDEPLSRDSLTEFLADERNLYLTVHIDGELAGTLHAIGYIHPAGRRYLYVDEVDPDEGFRRRGVATAMMRTALEIAREMAASAVWLGADDGNDAPRAFIARSALKRSNPASSTPTTSTRRTLMTPARR